MRRRVFLAASGALGALTAAPALAGTTGVARAAADDDAGRLRALPAGARPFDPAGRRDLLLDTLTFLVRQQGIFPGRWVYQLPAAPWLGGFEPRAARASFDVAVPGGAPLFLLAEAIEDNQLDPAAVTVTLDGVPIAGLAEYVLKGVSALYAGRPQSHAAVALVLAPPAAGAHTIEVRSRARAETTVTYRVQVDAPDALGPVLLRGAGDALYAIAGHVRRRIPDATTARTLGYAEDAVLDAGSDLLAALPEGEPLPALREGMLVRAPRCATTFVLRGGRRVATTRGDRGERGDDEALAIDTLTLHAIVPELEDGMLLRGALPDVFHVDRRSLRKVPSPRWLEEKGIGGEALYVPDRIIAALPQNSPHWVMPGGTSMDRSFHSAALGRAMPYRVYLPPSYSRADAAGRRFPVVYMLHGQSGRYDEWSGYGLEMTANELWQSGKMGEVIVVAPQGGLGYWMNQENGTPWADYVLDLVRHLDTTYRTTARREARAIGGLSMGGHGALQLALNYPETFGVVGAHSPSIRPRESAPAFMGSGAFFETRDPLSLIERAGSAQRPRIWLDAGRDDPWRSGAEALHRALQEKGWAHEWRVFDGGHDGWYWGDHLWDYLPFYATAFRSAGVAVGM